jgi:hypothetical protein
MSKPALPLLLLIGLGLLALPLAVADFLAAVDFLATAGSDDAPPSSPVLAGP